MTGGDPKYGRLFTERDVGVLLAAAYEHGVGVGLDVATGASGAPPLTTAMFEETSEQRLTFPADEPLFLLRGQDAASEGAIAHYIYECDDLDARPSYIKRVENDLAEWISWQRQHSQLVKVPE